MLIMQCKTYIMADDHNDPNLAYAFYECAGQTMRECKEKASKYPWFTSNKIGNSDFWITWIYPCDIEALMDEKFYWEELRKWKN